MLNMSIFSERLKELMSEREEMKSEQLAKEARISGSSIRSWIRGQSVPSFQSAVKLADYFCCSLDYLVGRTDKFEEILPRPLPPFYPHLRKIMEECKITRFRITTDTPIKDAFFTNWSRGEQPLLVTLCSLAQYLKVSLDYLVGRTDY